MNLQFEDWSVGQRIAAHRARRNMTQEQLAGLVGISLSLMKKIESGVRPVTKFSTLVLFAQALRIRDMRELTGVPLPMVADGIHGHPAADDVRMAMTEYVVGAVEPRRVARLSGDIERAWEVWQTASPWRYSQVGQYLPGLIREARHAVQAVDGEDKRRALQETSKLYHLVRTWTKRVGEHELSWLAADRAISAALEAHDSASAGAGSWNLAMILSAKGYTENASAIVRQAIERMAPNIADADDAWLAVWGGLHLLAATESARLDQASEAERFLNTARPIADRLGETNHYRMVFGPTNVVLHRLSTLVELGRTRDALSVAEGISVTATHSVERRLTYYLDTARSYARSKNDLAAVHMIQRMHQESPEELYFNSTVRETLRELMRRAKPAMRTELTPLLVAAALPD